MDDLLPLLFGLALLISLPAGLIMSIVALVKLSRRAREMTALTDALDQRFTGLEARLAALETGKTAPTRSLPEETAQDTVSQDPPSPEKEPASPGQADTPDESAAEDETDAPGPGEQEPPKGDAEEPARPRPWERPGQPWLAASNTNNQAGKSRKTFKARFEDEIGGRWAVLLGGLALALGLVFLVRYTIEAGLLGPAARITLGGLLSAVLLAAGEGLRRSDRSFNLPVYEKADIPGILTGTGAIGAFATLYAAHALYGFIGPGAAFIGLTAIGIATMLLSAVHGPKLAALGVLGAYGAPLLVATDTPNHLALALHVLVVTATVLATAHLRDWRWLAISGFVAATAWVCLLQGTPEEASSVGIAASILLIGLAILYFLLFWLRESPAVEDRPTTRTAPLAYGLLILGLLVQLEAKHILEEAWLATIIAVIIATLAAMRTATAPAMICAALVALLTALQHSMQELAPEGLTQTFEWRENLVPPDTAGFIWNAILMCLPAALIALYGTNRTARHAPRASGWLAAGVSSLAFFGVLITYIRIAPFETRPIIGAVALAIAALLAVATEFFARIRPEDRTAPAPAALAVGAIATACLAIAVALDTGWMPLAFALAAMGIAAVYFHRPLAVLPWLSLSAGAIAGLTLWANMPFELPRVEGWRIVNSLIPLLGIPAAALLAAGEILRRSTPAAPNLSVTLLTSGGLAVSALFVAFQITHFINDGSLVGVRHSLAEMAGYALAGIGFAIGLQKLGERSALPLFHAASQVAGVISVLLSTLGLLLVYNPYLSFEPVGEGLVFNLLLPAYLLTGLGAAAVALLARPLRPRWYTLMYAGLSGVLLFAYCSFMLRKAFQGSSLHLSRNTGDVEFWLYSPLWLVLGALLLTVGLWQKSLPLRLASAVLILLTVLKVFLLDMAELTGLLRALSFIGLGLSLIVIGRFYQRMLTRQANNPQAPATGDGQGEENA